MNNRQVALGASVALALSMLSIPAHATPNLVSNGDFEQTSNGTGQLGFNTGALGWSSANGTGPFGSQPAFNFLYTPGTADTIGASSWDGSFVKFWGPNNGVNNGLTGSPSGGNFIAADPAYYQGAISQTISGLTPGKQYTLSFNWAAAQQQGFSGPTTEQWSVSFGGENFTTGVVNNPSKGFTGWLNESHTFTATIASQILSFLALGGPQGLPPFVLLDGVSLTLNANNANAVPEPETFMLLGIGLVGLMAVRRQQRSCRA